MNQTSFAFHATQHVPGYESEAERRFLLGLSRAGWLQFEPANDNASSPAVWLHHRYPTTVLFSQLNLWPLVGLEHIADYCFRRYASPRKSLVVEIDGDAYHSSPKELARDKRIDRMIQATDGWGVHRYPAREVLDVRLCDHTVRGIHAHLDRWHTTPGVVPRVSSARA
jgi:hypothetical protein